MSSATSSNTPPSGTGSTRGGKGPPTPPPHLLLREDTMRSRTMLREFLLAALLLAGATALIAATGLDLALERRFFLAGNGWGLGEVNPWRALYRYGVFPVYFLAAAALALLVAGLFWERAVPCRKAALFCLLLLALGPGLLVNVCFKDHWGRPRPRQMQLFGGDRSFYQVWER